MISTALRFGAETAINRLIQRDANARARLADLAGVVITFMIDHPRLTLTVTPTSNGLMWRATDDLPPDARIHTSGAALLAALQHEHASDSLFTGDLTIEGDEQAATRFLRALSELDIDWADWLAEKVGVSAAGVVEQAARKARQTGAEWRETRRIEQHDFLVHEARVIADDFDLPDFLDGVDEARSAVERLERRIERLEAATPGNAPQDAAQNTAKET
ncbi:SCP2 sterol-binding domain-containing protein [Guyparkeria sp. GHLCS8-2]|uniref:ubiquinone biosynthesis accessory factor UbiJ n=1 Tax=Guyparkeria halopsychrophila TaxID=3139421 RepID=UPI0037CB024F